jgi:hypothetical protein
MPGDTPSGTEKTIDSLGKWQDWNTWKVSYKDIEKWTGIKFFETSFLSSSLLADSEEDISAVNIVDI